MEIKIKSTPGCMRYVIAVATLGVHPVLTWMGQRNWPKSADDRGLVTRAGGRVAWNEFTRATPANDVIMGRTGRYVLSYPGGTVVLSPGFLHDGDRVFDYVWQRLPAQAKQA